MAHNYTGLPTDDDSDDRGGLQYDRRLNEQNQSLEILGDSVLRLGQLSLNISEEIDSQNRMLTKLEVDVEAAQENVDSLTKRTQELVKKAGGPKLFCVIVALTIVLIILILLDIYT